MEWTNARTESRGSMRWQLVAKPNDSQSPYCSEPQILRISLRKATPGSPECSRVGLDSVPALIRLLHAHYLDIYENISKTVFEFFS